MFRKPSQRCSVFSVPENCCTHSRCLCSLLLFSSGEVQINPGPLRNCKKYLSIYQWNLNSISAHDYSELFLLKACIILYEFDDNNNNNN